MSLGVRRPHPKGVGPSIPQFFGTFTDTHMVGGRATKFGMVTLGEGMFLGVTRPHPKGTAQYTPNVLDPC